MNILSSQTTANHSDHAVCEAWTDFAFLNAGIVGWKTNQGMDVCVRLFRVCVVLCG
jgi:hypothetical protein